MDFQLEITRVILCFIQSLGHLFFQLINNLTKTLLDSLYLLPDFGNPVLKNKWPGPHEAENPWGVTSASLEVSPRREEAEK